jgi:hypothetical protein
MARQLALFQNRQQGLHQLSTPALCVSNLFPKIEPLTHISIVMVALKQMRCLAPKNFKNNDFAKNRFF